MSRTYRKMSRRFEQSIRENERFRSFKIKEVNGYSMSVPDGAQFTSQVSDFNRASEGDVKTGYKEVFNTRSNRKEFCKKRTARLRRRIENEAIKKELKNEE